MADGGHLENQKVRCLQNRLADFDEIDMAMHISRFNPISNEKFENPMLRTASILKIKKT